MCGRTRFIGQVQWGDIHLVLHLTFRNALKDDPFHVWREVSFAGFKELGLVRELCKPAEELLFFLALWYGSGRRGSRGRRGSLGEQTTRSQANDRRHQEESIGRVHHGYARFDWVRS